MLNKNTIKSEVNKQFKNVEIVSVEHKSFGIFVVKVLNKMPKTKKIGLIFGETDFEKSENGVLLDKEIDWI